MKWARFALIALIGLSLAGAGKPRSRTPAKAKPKTEGSGAARDTRTVYLSEDEIATIWIHPEGTILSFPAKPSQVIVGRESQFDVQYVGADVALVALTQQASASAFIYLLGRRYGFSLKTSTERGDRLVFVRDARDTLIDVEIR